MCECPTGSVPRRCRCCVGQFRVRLDFLTHQSRGRYWFSLSLNQYGRLEVYSARPCPVPVAGPKENQAPREYRKRVP
jgi:hypothetical protein